MVQIGPVKKNRYSMPHRGRRPLTEVSQTNTLFTYLRNDRASGHTFRNESTTPPAENTISHQQ